MTCYASNLYDGTTYRFQVTEVCLETYLNSLFYNDDVNDETNYGQPTATWTARTTVIFPPEVNLHLPEANTTAKPSLVIIGYHVNIE